MGLEDCLTSLDKKQISLLLARKIHKEDGSIVKAT